MITKKELSKHVGSIGYDIIDEIISPICGISNVVADLYLVSIETYASEKEDIKKIFKLISEKYKVAMNCWYFASLPIVALAIHIMEGSDYLKDYYSPRKIKKNEAMKEISEYIIDKRKKKIIKMSSLQIAQNLNLPIQQVEKIMDKWEKEGRVKLID